MTMPGESFYAIEYEQNVIRHDLPEVPTAILKRIRDTIEVKLTTNPLAFGKPLRHNYKGHLRLRVGDYRIIYRIEQSKRIVKIIHISHRKNVYTE